MKFKLCFIFNCFLNRIYYIQRHKLIMLFYISLPFARYLWRSYISIKMYVKGGKYYRFSLFTFIEFSNSEVPHLCLPSSCCSCKTCKYHGSFKQAFPFLFKERKFQDILLCIRMQRRAVSNTDYILSLWLWALTSN